jgi:hypothetical protein
MESSGYFSGKLFLTIVLNLSLFILLLFTGCEKLDNPETIPSYITIEKISLVDNPDITEGTLSNKIVDAWVYVDDQLIGAFEMPCTIPVLAHGMHKIDVKAGVYLNGVVSTRVNYPFYATYSVERELVQDSIIRLNPVVWYEKDCVIPWLENFEIGGVTIESSPISDTAIFKTNDPSDVFEGNYSGKVVLTADHPYFLNYTIDEFVLPQAGSNVFLEINYKTSVNLLIGVYANAPTEVKALEVAGVFPTEEWKKVYINLTTVVSRESSATTFKLFFSAQLPDGQNEATVLLDNIKLIHY